MLLSILALYNYDNSIFDGLKMPQDENFVDILDKDTVIDTICSQNAELELLYSDPDTMKKLIKLWSDSSQYSWQKLAESLYFDYNPIWNKDGTIKEHETGGSGSSSEEKVAAYNSATYEPRSYSNGRVDSGRDLERTEQGNIGTVSTQKLIQEEREVAMFNIYDRISEDFRNRFCLMVY